MAAADVFAFPSLFEGSAVVTYEALACGLPSVVTPESGSVARDGVDGFVVPSGDASRRSPWAWNAWVSTPDSASGAGPLGRDLGPRRSAGVVIMRP